MGGWGTKGIAARDMLPKPFRSMTVVIVRVYFLFFAASLRAIDSAYCVCHTLNLRKCSCAPSLYSPKKKIATKRQHRRHARHLEGSAYELTKQNCQHGVSAAMAHARYGTTVGYWAKAGPGH